MADIRINALATTAASTASDDYIAIDGSANGTRKLNAYSPTFGGNLTVSGTGGVQLNSVANLTWGGAYGAGIPTIAIPSATSIGFYPTGSTSGKTFELFGTGNATLAGNLTVSGGTITGGASGMSLAAGGTNQNITLTPTGTGATVISKAETNTNAITTALNYLKIQNTSSGGTYIGALEFYTWDNRRAAGIFAERNNVDGTSGILSFAYSTSGNSFAEGFRLNHTGNLLIGTTTDSGNGKLQLATHTNSAGGIGFGTALSMYRSSDNSAWIDAASGNVQLVLGRAGAANLAVLSDGSNVYASAAQVGMGMILRTNGGTAALTLDASQNATFAGAVLSVGSGSNNAVCRVTASNGKTSDFGDDTTGGFVRANNSQSLRFITNSIAAITIDTSQDTTFSGQIVATKTTGAFRIATAETPASASATGTIGTIAWDTSYIYVCTATNTWKRVAIATW